MQPLFIKFPLWARYYVRGSRNEEDRAPAGNNVTVLAKILPEERDQGEQESGGAVPLEKVSDRVSQSREVRPKSSEFSQGIRNNSPSKEKTMT